VEAQNILAISDRKTLYDWYKANHKTCREFWIRSNRSRKGEDGVIGYDDAVEVALCFGWIDSTQKRLDDGKPFQRFTPRRNCANWCERNLNRCRRLIESGEMTEAGMKVLPK